MVKIPKKRMSEVFVVEAKTTSNGRLYTANSVEKFTFLRAIDFNFFYHLIVLLSNAYIMHLFLTGWMLQG